MHGQDRIKQRADQRSQSVEDGNAASNEVRGDGDAESTGEPRSPVNHGIVGQVLRSSEQADEDVLGRQLCKTLVFTKAIISKSAPTDMEEQRCRNA